MDIKVREEDKVADSVLIKFSIITIIIIIIIIIIKIIIIIIIIIAVIELHKFCINSVILLCCSANWSKLHMMVCNVYKLESG